MTFAFFSPAPSQSATHNPSHTKYYPPRLSWHARRLPKNTTTTATTNPDAPWDGASGCRPFRQNAPSWVYETGERKREREREREKERERERERGVVWAGEGERVCWCVWRTCLCEAGTQQVAELTSYHAGPGSFWLCQTVSGERVMRAGTKEPGPRVKSAAVPAASAAQTLSLRATRAHWWKYQRVLITFMKWHSPCLMSSKITHMTKLSTNKRSTFVNILPFLLSLLYSK